MTEITEILKNLSTYGTPLLIVAIILFFAVKFGNVLVDDFKRRRSGDNHDELTELRNQLSATINAVLERAMLKTRACRVYVFEFHNGSMSIGGLPFLKMTNTYEALGEGAKTEMHKRESMPFHLFQNFVNAIYENDYIVMDVDDRTNVFTQFEYETLVQRNVSLLVAARITDINRKVIGHLGIDYCGERPDETTLKETIRIVLDVSVELNALLTVEKRKEQNFTG